MISDILILTRPLIVPDTETTGVDTTNDRIVELAFHMYDATGLIKKFRTLVNPFSTISMESSEVHGITVDNFIECRACKLPRDRHPNLECKDFYTWPTFKQLAPNLATGFSNCDYAGKNVRFDLRILSAEFARAGVPWTIGDARIIDADRLEALLVPRSLSHLYKKYTERTLEGAHGAMADVEGTVEVIDAQLRTTSEYDITLPRDLDELHALQWQSMIDLEGKFAFDKDGVPCFTRWGKFAGKPMTTADTGYWDFILSKDFAHETKMIAGQAKLGKFPMRKK